MARSTVRSRTPMRVCACCVAVVLLCCLYTPVRSAAKDSAAHGKYVVKVAEQKEWKRLLKTRTNVLAVFTDGAEAVAPLLPALGAVADRVAGQGTIAMVDCRSAKKLCKTLRLKVPSGVYLLKHYSQGSFHKDYDRLLTEKSMLGFMQSPTSDPPWSEDPSASDVLHIEGPTHFERVLKKDQNKPVLVMFYTPWCGHCKALKPEFAQAATELKKVSVLAGMDVDAPESYGLREALNITGFPTLLYFRRERLMYRYGGGRDAKSIVEWMRNPRNAPEPEGDEGEEGTPWSEEESEITHLTTESFGDFVSGNPSVLVMFYAPWCGHCKAMKPEYTKAAVVLKEEGVQGKLAAVDVTENKPLGERFGIKGFPTVKYFSEGEMRYDYAFERSAEAVVDFMREPHPPPPPEKEWSEIESQVVHLTDESFKGHVKKKKQVLVMFYAPWCGHCKAAKPEYTAAADRFTGNKKKSFAALDCTKYPPICEQHGVEGYPTFKFFNNYGKKVSDYYGSREEDGFSEFMSDPPKDEL